MVSIFTNIINGEIPATKLYEDDVCIAILDLFPNNKGHTLVIPKVEHESITDYDDTVLQHVISVVKKVAQKQMDVLSCAGNNIVVNNKHAAGQEIPHLHFHIIPRYENDGHTMFSSKKEEYAEGEMNILGEKLKL